MRNKEKLRRSQSGQILIYTTIIVMLAALILGPLMQFAFTSHRSAQIREERTLELYASDAGIEDALYQIKTEQKGSALGNLAFGSASYNPGTPGMNDRTENVSVEKVWIPQDLSGNLKTEAPTTATDKSSQLVVVGMLSTIQATAASEDFNSGGWSGGNGSWAGAWTHTGSAAIASSTQGCGGSGYALGFTDADGSAERTANLLRYMKPQLKLNAKAASLDAGDSVDLKVKYGDSDWETPVTWGDGNETSGCEAFSIDLYDLYGWGGNDTSVPLQIAFDANLSTQTVAQDDFSTGNWAGGSGWSSNWTPTGSASVTSTGSPYSPDYHVKITSTGEVRRKVSLTGIDRPSLTFWVKASSFGSGDQASLRVSTDGTNWTTKQTWTSSQGYTAYTLDLSSYSGAATLWISFKGAMGTSGTAFASDNFESGWPNSGSGWAGSWATSSSGNGAVGIYSGSSYSHGGTHALQLSRSGSSSGTATATRVVNVSGQSNPQIRFYARSRSADGSDTLTLKLSADGSSWTTIPLSVSSSYQSFTYNVFDYVPQGTTQVWVRFYANMSGSYSDTSDYFYIDDISILSTPCLYFDDVIVSEGSSFYADDLWIGDQYNSNTIEIAYTDANLGGDGIAYLDRIGIWMPPGCHYVSIVGNETTPELSVGNITILPNTYAGGTIVEWDFASPGVELHKPILVMPKVKTLTFTYEVDVKQHVEGMFTWIKAHGPSGQPYISWDKGYEVYKAVSQAHSEIYGTNTQVTAYATQGEVNKKGAASYGDYVATGAALLFDDDRDDIKDVAVNPSNQYTWVTYPTSGGFLYDGRDEISSIPSDAHVTAAWLYWSAFMKTSDWQGSGSKADGDVSFMYPKRYGPETFAVYADGSNNTYSTAAWRSPGNESMDLLAHQPVLTLSQVRYAGEVLGNATAGYGNDTFWTAHPSIKLPAPTVRVGGVVKSQSGNYTINYDTGNVTIINDALSGQVTIDYWASGLMTLRNGTDYAITQDVLGQDIRYTGFTVGNDTLQGNVTVDYYYAKHWVAVQHAAYDKYGTALSPAQTEVDDPDYGYQGNTYACFADVTQLLTGNGMYTGVTGDGQYAVGNVTATLGVPNDSTHHYGTRCFSGWSLIVLYESPTKTAHQFYLWDPIHNAADCPFMVQPNTDSLIQPPCIYVPPNVNVYVPFTLNDFYPPEGTVSGTLTYFVGEGDANDDPQPGGYAYDSVAFKGASQGNSSYTYLSGPNNPGNNVMNCLSTNGDGGIDIDTYNVTDEVGNDTAANVQLSTQGDRWYLVYMILSFKTNEVPKADFAFNVASVTYQYELGVRQ